MAANIQSLVNGINAINGASRDDVAVGDTLTVSSIDAATTYAWTLAFAPEGSTATFSGDVTLVSPGGFVADKEGPYLVRLTVDAGLGTESTQFVRLRVPTVFGSLLLVAAGERRDGTGIIPVDVDTEGWTNEQNANFLILAGFAASLAASGRILYVDPAVGYGDHSTVQAAIDAAITAGASLAQPYIVAIRPGLYTEALTLKAHVHLVGWPGNPNGFENQNHVVIRGTHSAPLANSGDWVTVANLTLENTSTTTSAVLDKSGVGALALSHIHVSMLGISGTQGPAVSLSLGSLQADNCHFEFASGGAASRVVYSQAGAGSSSVFRSCQFKGPSGLNINLGLLAGSTCSLRDCVVQTSGTGATGIQSSAELLLMENSRIEMDGTGTALAVHPSGGVISGDVHAHLRWCYVDGTVTIDDTNVAGTGALYTGASIHGTVTPTGSPSLIATSQGTSLFYDNTSTSMAAENVQEALDEVHALAVLVTSLDDAYDDGVPSSGGGRTIIADQGSVQIVDAASPSDPPPAGNTDGMLEVVGNIKIGALTKPELDLDPNPYGAGPQISMGQTVVPADVNHAEGNARILARSVVSTARNYNLLIQTESGINGSDIGWLVLQGGDSLPDASPPNAADVYVQAGSAYDTAAGNFGRIYLAPGQELTGSTGGSVRLVDPRASTAATLTAASATTTPLGVTGDITFVTSMGAVTVSLDAADNTAAQITKLSTALGITATDSGGGVLRLTTDQLGPTAEVFYVSADAGILAALGDFSIGGGATYVAGTYVKFVDIFCSDTQEITFGNGTNDFVYNAITGKLTVPGLIDPTGVVFTEAARPSTGVAEGALYVSDGSNGETQNALYYRAESDAAGQNISGGVGIDHGVLAGLGDDDHTQYPLLLGRVGGQTLMGDTAASGKLILESTSDATKGLVEIKDGSTLSVLTALELRQSSFDYTLTWADPAAARAISVPDPGGTDVFVFAAMTQTLAGKTLTTPTIASFVNATHDHAAGAGGGQLDHGLALTGLTDDDHTQYALLTGRAGGQILQGGSAASNDLTLESTSHGTKGRIVASDPIILEEATLPNTGVGEGALYVSPGGGSQVQGELYFKRDSNGTSTNISVAQVPYHFNMPEGPNTTVYYRGWAYAACKCVKIKVYCATVCTVGAYTLTVTNNGTGNTMLSAASFDMTSLVADTVTTPGGLTGTAADLVFAINDRWTVALTSDNAGFDGAGIYVELVFEAY